jgi:hypothetical protein
MTDTVTTCCRHSAQWDHYRRSPGNGQMFDNVCIGCLVDRSGNPWHEAGQELEPGDPGPIPTELQMNEPGPRPRPDLSRPRGSALPAEYVIFVVFIVLVAVVVFAIEELVR